MKIGFDLDGVLYDFTGAFKKVYESANSCRLPALPEPRGWNFYEHWGISKKEYMTFLDTHPLEIFNHPHHTMSNKDFFAIHEAIRVGHTIHVVTHRGVNNVQARMATVTFLSGIPFHSLVFSDDKTVIKTDTFIEDKPENFESLLAAGIDAYLMSQPWNWEYECPESRRVNSVQEYLDKATSQLVH